MTTEELMELSPKEALEELSWESIEWLFFPQNQLQLFFRTDYNGTLDLVKQQACGDIAEIKQLIKKEQFYISLLHERKEQSNE